MTTTKKTTKGITTLTMAKHRFNGYNVRCQKNHTGFRKYVSASECRWPKGKSLEQRMALARKLAVNELDLLNGMLNDPGNWRAGALKIAAKKTINALGFTTVKLTPPKPAVA